MNRRVRGYHIGSAEQFEAFGYRILVQKLLEISRSHERSTYQTCDTRKGQMKNCSKS